MTMGILKKKNKTIDRVKQAYKQAPWRSQLRSIGFYLLPVFAIAMVTIIYLNISAQAATAGLKIRNLREEEEIIQRSIANQRTQFAWLTSFEIMQRRAESLGYVLMDPNAATYMIMPGYQGRETILMAPLPGEGTIVPTAADPRFQQSLWDWFLSTFVSSSVQYQGGVQ